MLSQTEVDRVRRLLADPRNSQRDVAKKCGVSRATVSDIARGRRVDRPRAEESHFSDPMAPPIRCANCGGLVHPPCHLCRVRLLQNQASFPCDPAREGPAGDERGMNREVRFPRFDRRRPDPGLGDGRRTRHAPRDEPRRK